MKLTQAYRPRQGLLVYVELMKHTIWHARLVLELWSQPCSRQPLASSLAVRPTIGPRIGHHVHLKNRRGGKVETTQHKQNADNLLAAFYSVTIKHGLKMILNTDKSTPFYTSM